MVKIKEVQCVEGKKWRCGQVVTNRFNWTGDGGVTILAGILRGTIVTFISANCATIRWSNGDLYSVSLCNVKAVVS